MNEITSVEEYQELVKQLTKREGYQAPLAFGIGIATKSKKGKSLEVCFPVPNYRSGYDFAAILADVVGHLSGNKSYTLNSEACSRAQALTKPIHKNDREKNIQLLTRLLEAKKQALITFITEDVPPVSVEEVYLKLSLLSHRKVRPHQVNLEGAFQVLPNVAWTSEGAIDIEELAERQLAATISGKHLEVFSVDKFPKMINHVVPEKVRIADGARVRLGAYVGSETTVMHEGFINFNAGTEGPNMIEGRISSGVFVQRGSDLGGSSSTMGVLSGGNETLISVGKDCLIGANAGTGIPLGDNCIIEAGLYLTASTKVEILDETAKVIETAKASDLAFRPNLLFRRNSLTGAVQALPNKKKVELNEELHHGN